jgi:hypothetical protein
MDSFRKRASLARFAVAAAALLVPLVGAGAAQAAIGTSHGLITTNRPDFVSATIVNATQADYCFSKDTDAAAAFSADDFLVGGYKSATSALPATSAVRVTARCWRATFGTTGDLNQFTVAHLRANTLRPLQAGAVANNLDDSVPLIGSQSHAGTRGFTTGPDLQTTSVDTVANQMTYVFDQNVSPVPNVVAAGFHFTQANGTIRTATGVVGTGGNVVVVQYAAPAFVSDAVIAFVDPGSVVAAQGPPGANVGNNLLSVGVPGTGAATVRPDLTGNELALANGGSNQLLFTYDQDVAVGDATAYRAVLSNGAVAIGSAITLAGPRVARVTFNNPENLQNVSEYIVAAADTGGGVIAADGSGPSLPGGKPAGGNAGAFALGYTTAPDAVNMTFDGTSGQVTIRVDQRIRAGAVFTNQVNLLNSQGDLVANPATATISGQTDVPGQVNVILQFTPGQVQSAAGVQLDGQPFEGGALQSPLFPSFTNFDDESVAQVLAP